MSDLPSELECQIFEVFCFFTKSCVVLIIREVMILIRLVQIVNRHRLPLALDSLHNLSNELFKFMTGREAQINDRQGTVLSRQRTDALTQLKRNSARHADELQSLSNQLIERTDEIQRLSASHADEVRRLTAERTEEAQRHSKQSSTQIESLRARLKEAEDQNDQSTAQHRAEEDVLLLQLSAMKLENSRLISINRTSRNEPKSVRAPVSSSVRVTPSQSPQDPLRLAERVTPITLSNLRGVSSSPVCTDVESDADADDVDEVPQLLRPNEKSCRFTSFSPNDDWGA
jgi:hypothetical protein